MSAAIANRDPPFTSATIFLCLSSSPRLHLFFLVYHPAEYNPSCASMSSSGPVPTGASAAVLKPSEPMPDFAVTVEGPNFDEEISLQKLLGSYQRIGFQANSLGRAIDIVNKMVCCICACSWAVC